ncbi:glucose-1-phosphate thymidylyltransferase [Pontibacter ummariensis]|uniref:glucose-1-phosphate thymidylyltransferase n=1 Tax=Pontibacter ummariensis TaxID=1610492 RepID=A0A239GE88_9BACT|nr:sugar phosphate nucleotidyltransferase [Pontibacter ummariensis]PRY11224.1 glucose-1-phosphate thymidylyltransferase [Pontibacter ummariensis]SNS67460.1 glucose-1-phosphate thymidylyltransferase [Pontibacter ummariensis]
MPTEIVGLVPAAGLGSRLEPIPCSKELFPVGFATHPVYGKPHPKVVSQYLLEHMQRAGAGKAYFVLRKGKWDIPNYFGDGTQLGMHLAYLIMGRPYGTPFSLDQAYPFIQGKQVVFGFPDILFEPKNAFEQLLKRQQETEADVVLGLYKVPSPHKWDMVKTDDGGRVEHIVRKPLCTDLTYGWAIACWGARFTQFMHAHLEQIQEQVQERGQEVSVGEVIQEGIHNGLSVQSVCFDDSSCLDIGTPEDLRQAIKTLS